MKVVLVRDIAGIGKRGEIKDVSDGYWRNFLMPKAAAVLPESSEAKQLLASLAAKDEAEAAELEKLRQLAASFEGRQIELTAKTQGDRLFGAIREAEIAAALDIDKKLIKMMPIKTIGEHRVALDFGHRITATIMVKVHG